MKRVLPYIIIFILSLFSLAPLFQNGIFSMHDNTQPARVIEMGRALMDGQFPVRWVAHLGYGYGYPIYNFYGPLPYYLGGFLYAIGVSATVATKIMFGIGILAPAFILFWALNMVLGWEAALVSALFFLYAPYHAVEIYVRGAVGEYWAVMFWPVLLFVALAAVQEKKHTGLPVSAYKTLTVAGAFGLFGAITSHTLLGYATVFFVALMTTLLAFVSILRRVPVSLPVRVFSWAILGGLGLSAFFWLPALAEMKFTSVSGQIGNSAYYKDHFVCLSQLWSSVWGYAGSAKGCVDGVSFMLGKVHILAFFLGVFALWKKHTRKYKTVGVFAVALVALGVFLATPASVYVWELVPNFSYIQYPWRFLIVAEMGLAIGSGIFVASFRSGRTKLLITGILIALLLFFNAKWFQTQRVEPFTDAQYESTQDIAGRVSKISDEYLPPAFKKPDEGGVPVFDTIVQGKDIQTVVLDNAATEFRLRIDASEAQELTINRVYFPGWEYEISGTPVNVHVVDGLPVIAVASGSSIIRGRFVDTPVRTVANIVTLITALGGLVYYYGKQKNKTIR